MRDDEALRRLYDYIKMIRDATPTGEALVTLSSAQLEFLVGAIELAGEL